MIHFFKRTYNQLPSNVNESACVWRYDINLQLRTVSEVEISISLKHEQKRKHKKEKLWEN